MNKDEKIYVAGHRGLVGSSIIRTLNSQGYEIIWLFYLPILFKNAHDFKNAKTRIEQPDIKSLCTFVPVKSHPFNAWKYDKKNKTIYQYIKNDFYRRQDLPPAWIHYHYVCCFKVRVFIVPCMISTTRWCLLNL